VLQPLWHVVSCFNVLQLLLHVANCFNVLQPLLHVASCFSVLQPLWHVVSCFNVLQPAVLTKDMCTETDPVSISHRKISAYYEQLLLYMWYKLKRQRS